MKKKVFEEQFRKNADEVGRKIEVNKKCDNKEFNPYKEAYGLVEKSVDKDYDKLMQLKAECSLDSYDNVISAGIKVFLGMITTLTFMWKVMSDSMSFNEIFNTIPIIYLCIIPVLLIVMVQVHKKYKYVGTGEKYVKLAIDNMIKDYHIKW